MNLIFKSVMSSQYDTVTDTKEFDYPNQDDMMECFNHHLNTDQEMSEQDIQDLYDDMEYDGWINGGEWTVNHSSKTIKWETDVGFLTYQFIDVDDELDSKITDDQIVELGRKYKDDILNAFMDKAKEREYKIPSIIPERDIFDELLSMCSSPDFVGNVIDSIEDSIGMDEYGFEYTGD